MSILSLFTDPSKRKYTIQIFIVAFVLFYNSASAMYIYSFLPYMMVDFGVADNETFAGKFGAWLASGYFFARFLSSPFWGGFIDKYGRKRGLMIVLSTLATLTLVFGFAQNYWWALLIRLVTGFINGLSIIGKVLTTEVCPPEMKAVSISIISTLWSLGLTCGPFLGSAFYKWIPGWPYLASAIVVSGFGYLLVLLSWIYLDETLDEAQQKPKSNGVQMKEVSYKQLPEEKEGQESTFAQEDLDASHKEESSSVKFSADQTHEKIQIGELKSPKSQNEQDQKEQKDEKEIVITKKSRTFEQEFASMNRWQQFKYLLNIPNVIPLIFIFSINTFYATFYGEMIPFWGASQHKDGGLGFEAKDISDLFLYLSVPQLLIQLFLYPFLQKRKGDFWLLSVGHWMHIPMFLFLPFANWLPQNNALILKGYLVFWMFIRNLGSFMNFSSLQRYTNDTISAEKRGQINGFQVACSSLFQTAGPILGAYVLSWSMEVPRPFPFDYHFVFLVMTIITLVTLYVIYRLDFVDKERQKLRGEGALTT